MRSPLSLLLLLASQSQADADADADPALLVAAGHHAGHAGYGYEAAAYCANGGACVPPVFCAPNYLESLYDPAAPCYLAHGTPGVCCVPRKSPCKCYPLSCFPIPVVPLIITLTKSNIIKCNSLKKKPKQ